MQPPSSSIQTLEKAKAKLKDELKRTEVALEIEAEKQALLKRIATDTKRLAELEKDSPEKRQLDAKRRLQAEIDKARKEAEGREPFYVWKQDEDRD